MAHVIEDQQGVAEAEDRLRQIEGVRVRDRHRRLETRRRLVGEIADGATGEPWQPRHAMQWAACQLLAHGLQRIGAGAALYHAGSYACQPAILGDAGADAQHQVGVGADEGEARQPLAPFDAFQQVAIWAAGQLEIRGDWRLQVRGNLAPHRHERRAPRALWWARGCDDLSHRCDHSLYPPVMLL